MAGIPVYNPASGSVTYNGKTYSKSTLQGYLNKEDAGLPISGTEAYVLGAFKRGSQPSSGRYSGTASNSVTNPNSVLFPNVTQTRSTMSSSGPVRSAGSYQSGVNPTLTSQYQSLPSTQALTRAPGAEDPLGDMSLAELLKQQYLTPTIKPYDMQELPQLKSEADTAAESIYKPLMEALRQRQADYEKARQLGREDLAAQYAQQIADLKALAVSTQSMIGQQKESSNQAYTTGMQNLAQQTLQARNTNTGNYQAAQNIYGGELGQLGLTGPGASQPNAALLGDQTFSDAILQGIGNIGQTGMASGQAASNAAMAQLAANSASQFNSLQGQAGIARDQGLRDLDRDTLEKIMQGNIDIGQTQSDWNAKAYELLKALQGTEWEKYMGAGQAAFGQQEANANLALGLLGAQSSAADSAEKAKLTMNPVELGQLKLQQSIQGLTPEKQQGFMDVWNMMVQPGNIINPGQTTPFGELATGTHPSLQQFSQDSSQANRQGDAFKRAWLSLHSRGLVDSTGKDAPWLAFRDAMIAAMTTNKAIDLSTLG